MYKNHLKDLSVNCLSYTIAKNRCLSLISNYSYFLILGEKEVTIKEWLLGSLDFFFQLNRYAGQTHALTY